MTTNTGRNFDLTSFSSVFVVDFNTSTFVNTVPAFDCFDSVLFSRYL